jgi:N-methylhydantoinase B
VTQQLRHGAAGSITLDDGTMLQPKGWQLVPEGCCLILQLPGGGGIGDPTRRDPEIRARDNARS